MKKMEEIARLVGFIAGIVGFVVIMFISGVILYSLPEKTPIPTIVIILFLASPLIAMISRGIDIIMTVIAEILYIPTVEREISKKLAYLLTSNENFTYFECYKITKEKETNLKIISVDKDLLITKDVIKNTESFSGHTIISLRKTSEKTELVFKKAKEVPFKNKDEFHEVLKRIKEKIEESRKNLNQALKEAYEIYEKNPKESEKITLQNGITTKSNFVLLGTVYIKGTINSTIIYIDDITDKEEIIARTNELICEKALAETIKNMGFKTKTKEVSIQIFDTCYKVQQQQVQQRKTPTV